MKTVWKYSITNMDGTTIHVPYYEDKKFNEQVLFCDVQNGVPCLWALVDTERQERAIRVLVVGTGHNADVVIDRGLRHVGSFMLLGGRFVGHVFVSEGEEVNV